MSKYRIVQFESGLYGVQKRNFLGFWFTTGDVDCDLQGFSYGWTPYTFSTRKLAQKHKKLCERLDNQYKIRHK